MIRSQIRTGVIGVGSMGQNHARVYSEISNLVGISDLDKMQGEKIADKLGVSYFENYEDLLEKIDAISIAVPTINHCEIAIKAAERGVHILVEKPIAHNLEAGRNIILAAKENQIKLCVGHIERYNPVVTYSKKALQNGEWGEMVSVSSRRCSNFPERVQDVSVLMDLGIHDVDVIRYLIDSEVSEVFSMGGSHFSNKLDSARIQEDYAILLLKFNNKKIANCETNWLTPKKIRELWLTTTKYLVEIDYITQSIFLTSSTYQGIDESDLYHSNVGKLQEKVKLTKEEPLRLELIDFLDAIINDNSPLCTGEDGIAALKIVEAAQKSIESGEIVRF